MSDIESHRKDIHDIDLWDGTISRITDKILLITKMARSIDILSPLRYGADNLLVLITEKSPAYSLHLPQ